MNFDDLNDEIGADDWLIPKREITRRKLVKQTSRFKIYKADWFGDVLVYEPIKHNLASRRCRSHRAGHAPSEAAPSGRRCEIDQEAFRSKLSELCLDLRARQADVRAPSSPGTPPDNDEVDSAYSSISTTPQYHTKHNLSLQCEFAFPATQVTQTTTVSGHEQEMKSSSGGGGNNHNKSACCLSPANSPPVVLNRDSFTFGHSCNSEPDTSNCATQDKKNVISAREEDRTTPVATTTTTTTATEATTMTSGGWFELNELRLVAHENFMLFMGASLDNNEEVRTMNESMEHNASLVMQMSHPKSSSLRDLLHANNNSCSGVYSSTSSPVDRFFSARSRPQPRAHLTVEAKLNICQQVTNAMTYLHEKNIVHGRLTSVNIYIEQNQRVKISLLDNDEQQIAAASGQAPGQSCRLNLGALTYLSPELIRSLRVIDDDDDDEHCDNNRRRARPGVHMDTRLITREADIFAFGTLLFELFEERFPFAARPAPATLAARASPALASPEARHAANAKLFDTLCLESARSPSPMFNYSPGLFSTPTSAPNEQHRRRPVPPTRGNIKLSASELIYQIGSGQIAARNARSVGGGNTPALVDHIISACWAREPRARPSFKQLKFE